ncbi:MAG: hypothetical protein GTO02_14380 [Candidatus Dadabacteria bacterium]|nr:hypothetical protein [Candidatus Dadabacteria bacterium]NIQ15532.1 hypothetical protein [Candidatus Dadabacteria bacterium]
MEMFISMKAENINPTMFKHMTMDMPSPQSNGYFIAEFRDSEIEKVSILHRYSSILEEKLQKIGFFLVENTNRGIKVKKKVDETKDYMEEWEGWVEFSRNLFEELESFFEED